MASTTSCGQDLEVAKQVVEAARGSTTAPESEELDAIRAIRQKAERELELAQDAHRKARRCKRQAQQELESARLHVARKRWRKKTGKLKSFEFKLRRSKKRQKKLIDRLRQCVNRPGKTWKLPDEKCLTYLNYPWSKIEAQSLQPKAKSWHPEAWDDFRQPKARFIVMFSMMLLWVWWRTSSQNLSQQQRKQRRRQVTKVLAN